MTSFSSVGDQSRSYQLRLSQYLLKSKLDRLTKEVATGLKSDIPLALNGDLARISHVDSRITMLATYQQNASEAKTMFESTQRALERIQSLTDSIGPSVMAEANTSPDDILRMRASQIALDFETVFSTLNTDVGGRHLFSGNRTDTAPLGSFDNMISGLNAAVAGATAANDIITRIDDWFDAPAGAGGFTDLIYNGNDSGNTRIAISDERTVGSDLTANSPELKNLLKGMAALTFVARSGAGLDSTAMREIFTESGHKLVRASTDLTVARAMVGLQEAATAQTQTQNTAENTSLSLIRSALISADPYETATALQETEASIQNLYTLTARLSRLKLTDYL